MTRICLTPRVQGVGGMVSFQHKLAAGLEKLGIGVCYDLDDLPYDSVLVIGGTRELWKLIQARRRGVRIVQRLDGINWIHRRRPVSIKHFLRAEYGNFVLSFIRRFSADRIVYQSAFSKQWWESWYGATRVPYSVIHNAVDLDQYTPQGAGEKPAGVYRLLVVEGSMGGGYDTGLENAVRLAEMLADDHRFTMELMAVGKISDALKAEWQAKSRVPIRWAGLVPREQIPEIDRSAHIFFSADIHPACPNAAIESLACGLPVIAFDTGALPELVTGDSGRVIAYGGDAWKLDPPDIAALARGAAEILNDLPRFQRAARQKADESFGLDQMIARYLDALIK
jgi:glycosyltransferase involved in cell wall biosynthesis